MATTAKKAPAKKTAAKKTTTRKAAPKKAASTSNEFNLKASAEKAVNVYLGVLGMGIDRVQENLKNVRAENKKRMTDLEKRGAKLRKELKKEINDIDVPEFDSVVGDVKEQINKLQDQLEDAVESAREKLTPAKKAA